MDSNPQTEVAEALRAAFTPEEAQTAEPETEQAPIQPESPELEQEVASTSETLETPTQTESEIDTLNNLAEELDISIEDMYALNFNMPNSEPVSLGELKNFYQDNKDLDASRQKLETERSQLQAEAEKLKVAPPVHPQEVQAQAALMLVQQEWQSTNWDELRVNNPAEFSARQIDLKNRYEVANSALMNVNQVIETQDREKRVAAQAQLFERVPELKDEAVRVSTTEQLASYISGYGFTAKDLDNIDNPNLMHLLIDAAKQAALVTDAGSKKVNTAPRVLKPQSVQNSQAGRKASLKRLTEKARNSNSSRDKASAIEHLIR